MASPATAPADRVVKPAAGVGYDLFIFSVYEKPGWQTRRSGDRIHPTHPGTAISYEDALYELIEIGPAPGTRYTYRYAMQKWEDRFVARQVVPYTAETARSVAVEIQQRQKQHRRHSWLIYLFPLTGLLPTPLLRRWQREWGLPMRGVALASAVVLGLPALRFAVEMLQAGKTLAATVLFCIGLEQVVRFFWMLGTPEALGSFLVTAVWGLWADLRGIEPDGTPKRHSTTAVEAERDEVRRLVDQPWDIEVISRFRVPALVGEAPVRFEDAVYQPLGYIQQGEGIRRRYIFRLKKLDEGSEAVREYSPEHSVSQVARLMVYERARDRVAAYALLCGYLPAARQLELQEKYDYDSAAGTERSAMVLLIAAGLQFATWAVRPFGLPHVVAAALIVESLYRWALVRARGEPVGSAAGWLFRPFLRF